MNTRAKLLLIAFLACCFILYSGHGYAEPVQLFLDAPSESICNLPTDIEVLVLNQNGELQRDFQDVHELQISVEERGKRDQSYTVSSGKVKFKEGKASFSIENSEEETIDLDVALKESGASGQIRLSFLNKDIFPPKIVDIFEEAPGILKLEFNEELEEESAQEERNYLAITNKREVHPESIEYHRSYVLLKFEEHFGMDEEGYIEVEGLQDLSGNEIESGLKSPDFDGTCEDACAH